MNHLYFIIVLTLSDQHTYISCLQEIDSRIKFMYAEGYTLANRLFIFSSDRSLSEINASLTDLPAEYSYILLDATDSINNEMIFTQVDKLFKKNQQLKKKFDNLIASFNSTKKLAVTKDSTNSNKLDNILDKISATGINSLTPDEHRILESLSV